MKTALALTLLTVLLGITGCGVKGPLYLPGEKSADITASQTLHIT